MSLGTALISILQAALVAAVSGYFARESKRRKKADEENAARAEVRKKESLLMIQLVMTCLRLASATAIAVRDKDAKCIVVMGRALDDAKEAELLYNGFLQESMINSR